MSYWYLQHFLTIGRKIYASLLAVLEYTFVFLKIVLSCDHVIMTVVWRKLYRRNNNNNNNNNNTYLLTYSMEQSPS